MSAHGHGHTDCNTLGRRLQLFFERGDLDKILTLGRVSDEEFPVDTGADDGRPTTATSQDLKLNTAVMQDLLKIRNRFHLFVFVHFFAQGELPSKDLTCVSTTLRKNPVWVEAGVGEEDPPMLKELAELVVAALGVEPLAGD